MKKLLCVTIALLCTATMQAQDEKAGVTKFLGIPVDGYKPAMIEKAESQRVHTLHSGQRCFGRRIQWS